MLNSAFISGEAEPPLAPLICIDHIYWFSAKTHGKQDMSSNARIFGFLIQGHYWRHDSQTRIQSLSNWYLSDLKRNQLIRNNFSIILSNVSTAFLSDFPQQITFGFIDEIGSHIGISMSFGLSIWLMSALFNQIIQVSLHISLI